MKKRFNISTTVALMLLAAAVTFTLTYSRVTKDLNEQLKVSAEQQAELKKYIQVKDYIEEFFIGDFDEAAAQDASITGLMKSLNDKWSYYMDQDEYQAYLEAQKNAYVGIGISADFSEQEQGLVVSEVYEGSPAQQAGIKVLDVIAVVDGQAVGELGADAAATAIKGTAGSMVSLGIADEDGEIRTVEVARADVTRELVKSEILNNNIGYLRIASFEEGSAADFKDSVGLLLDAGVQGLIFDVRMNPGGSPQEMVNMLDELLGEGDLLISVDKSGNREVKTSDASGIDLPMLVLVNQYTYNTAEYFAAVLQEDEKAGVVGFRTTGKCYAQVPIMLDDGTAIVLSTKEYFTPAGRSLKDTGVIPDYPALMTDEAITDFSNLSHEDDVPLQRALGLMQDQIAQITAAQEEQTAQDS